MHWGTIRTEGMRVGGVREERKQMSETSYCQENQSKIKLQQQLPNIFYKCLKKFTMKAKPPKFPTTRKVCKFFSFSEGFIGGFAGNPADIVNVR